MRSGSDRLRKALRLVLVLFVALVVVPAPASAQTGVDAGDELLLVKVRQAGLWEMPAGTWAETRGADPKVREVGAAIMVDHGRLDVLTRQLAAKLGVVLPAEPSAQQMGWLDQLQKAPTPQDFDRLFANLLRAAHGQVFSVIAQVRAGTRNPEIRAYATVANQAVLRHMTLLESTGQVDFNALPSSQVADSATPAGNALDLQSTDLLTAALLFVLVGGATLLGVRYAKSGRVRGRRLRPNSGETHG